MGNSSRAPYASSINEYVTLPNFFIRINSFLCGIVKAGLLILKGLIANTFLTENHGGIWAVIYVLGRNTLADVGN